MKTEYEASDRELLNSKATVNRRAIESMAMAWDIVGPLLATFV